MAWWKRGPSIVEFAENNGIPVRAVHSGIRNGIIALRSNGNIDVGKSWPFVEREHSTGFGAHSGYAGTSRDPRNDDWITGSSSGNSEVQRGGKALRSRAQDQARNNPYAHGANKKLASFMSGVQVRSAIPVPIGASKIVRDSINAENETIDREFQRWAETADATGDQDLAGLEFQACNAVVESGGVLSLIRTRPKNRIPFRIELLEEDLLDPARTEGVKGGGWIMQGVQFSQDAERLGYWLFPRHPAESSILLGDAAGSFGAAGLTSKFFPIDRVAHFYPRLFARPGQVRGVPWGHASSQGMRDFDGFMDAYRVLMRSAATFMGVMENPNAFSFDEGDSDLPDGWNPIRDSGGNIIERLAPGTIGYAYDGQKMNWSNPPTAEGFSEYVVANQQGMASGMLMPYELYTGDLSNTNFSSLMFGMGPFWRLMRTFQLHATVPMFWRPVWRNFVRFGRLSGVLRKRDHGYPAAYVPSPFPAVDPLKQTAARLIQVRAGASTIESWIRELGGDPEEVLSSAARLQEWGRDNNTVLDSDPSRTSQKGTANAAEAPTEEEERAILGWLLAQARREAA